MIDFSDDAALDAALRARGPTCADRVVVCVTTTGTYCRPSCRARKPKRENAVFRFSTEACRAAGFRACKFWAPDGVSPPAGP